MFVYWLPTGPRAHFAQSHPAREGDYVCVIASVCSDDYTLWLLGLQLHFPSTSTLCCPSMLPTLWCILYVRGICLFSRLFLLSKSEGENGVKRVYVFVGGGDVVQCRRARVAPRRCETSWQPSDCLKCSRSAGSKAGRRATGHCPGAPARDPTLSC